MIIGTGGDWLTENIAQKFNRRYKKYNLLKEIRIYGLREDRPCQVRIGSSPESNNIKSFLEAKGFTVEISENIDPSTIGLRVDIRQNPDVYRVVELIILALNNKVKWDAVKPNDLNNIWSEMIGQQSEGNTAQ